VHASLSAKVDFLRRPDSYPEPVSEVVAVETHMSWVFLAGPHAWKLKKPIRFEKLDFGTLEARRWNCHEEVRVNRRLAPEVYLGVFPLVRDGEGLRIGAAEGEQGEIVEWLVKMVRLPPESLLDRQLREGRADPEGLRRALRRLARFYLASSPEPISPLAWRERFEARVCANLRELADPAWGLPHGLADELHRDQLRWLHRACRLLDDRVRQGRVVEGHGDLRPEHVCLGPEPLVIDSLEFDRTLRLADPADELGFLAMECERLGAPWVRDLALGVWSEESGDQPPAELVHWYQSVRACTRAKLALWHLRDPFVRTPERWPLAAREYLSLARLHADIAVAGL
jgi:aminoglycoside phosphotransferase family enzyme